MVCACAVGCLIKVSPASAQALAAALDVSTVLGLGFAAALVWPRRMHANRADDGVVFAWLATLAATYGIALVFQVLFREHGGSRFVALAPVGELAAGLALLAGFKTSAARWVVPGGGLRVLSILSLLTLAAALAVGLLPFHVRSAWGEQHLAVSLGSNGASGSVLTGAVAAVACGLTMWAAYRIRICGGRLRRGATAWLSLGLALFALATLARLLPAGFLAGAIPVGDTLRVCATAVILVAVWHRESVLRLQAARRAALAERQRVARDLHDGIAQDLAFIAAHGARAGDIGQAMASAARRALGVTRGVIDDLSDLKDAPVPEALSVLAQEMEDRFGVSVRVEVDRLAAVPADISNDLFRMVREAIANAARHGGAANILVAIEPTETGLMLRVRDDGRGIGTGTDGQVSYGFGLKSMSRRAASTGAHLSVGELESGGTEVVVAWP